MAELFAVAEGRSPHWEYRVHLSMVEVYRERVYDLLGEESMVEVQIKLGNEGSHLAGVKWIHVKTTEEAIKVRSGRTGAIAVTYISVMCVYVCVHLVHICVCG